MSEAAERQLPPGWRLDENGALCRETIHTMKRRCRDWDYRSRCIYMITIELADRRTQALGKLKIASKDGAWVDSQNAKTFGLRPEEIRAKIELSGLGAAVVECWRSIEKFYPQVKSLACQVMPDHFHGLLFVTEKLDCHLGQIVKGFKLGCNKAARVLSPTILSPGAGLFADGFVDTILWREGQLKAEFDYLAANPFRLAVKTLYPDLFKSACDIAVSLPGLSPDAIGHFGALGNRFLLKRPMLQVQISRRVFGYKRISKPGGGLKIAHDEKGEPIVEFESEEFRERKADLLAAAKHGAVLLSPCISDGERQIAREALATNLPLITMSNKGFSKLQKPSGRYFDACAEGRLLMLAPAAWPYQPGEKPMTRFDATAMNRLCQWIVGEDAAEINYHGMKPANIDRLAKEAAKVA